MDDPNSKGDSVLSGNHYRIFWFWGPWMGLRGEDMEMDERINGEALEAMNGCNEFIFEGGECHA